MNKLYALLISPLLLSGCQAWHAQQPAPQAPAETASTAPPAKRYAPLDQDTTYRLLSAELAGQRGRFDIALGNYVQEAKASRDPGVAERAFQIADYLGARQVALDSALIWADAAPESLSAQRAAAIELARAGRFSEALPRMERILEHKGKSPFDFLALAASETDEATRAGLLQSFDQLLEKHPNTPQLIFGKALLLQQENQPEAALALLESLPEADQKVAPLLLRSRILHSLKRPKEALAPLERGLARFPNDQRLQLEHARLLVEAGQLERAQSEFAALLQAAPEDDDLRLSLALLYLENRAYDEARVYLQELIEREAHADIAHFNLARTFEAQNEPDSALAEYRQVGPGKEFLPAQLRYSALMLDAGKAPELHLYLTAMRSSQPDLAIQLYLIESEVLAEHGLLKESAQVLEQALGEHPDDLNLHYSRAMLAEKRGDIAGLERDLRFIINQEPNNAMALNALGYTLADRTERFAEALALIEQARQINPNDPAIADSLGWVHFRLGQLDKAEELLRDAYARYPDAEVAAHYGEVLWVQGKERKARKIWKEAQEAAPGNAILKATVKRLTGKESL